MRSKYRTRNPERRLRYRLRMALHNMVGHPLMEVSMWEAMLWDRLGCQRLARWSEGFGEWCHNVTLPPKDQPRTENVM